LPTLRSFVAPFRQPLIQTLGGTVDGIKVVYQGHTNEHGEVILPRISIETLQAITAEARKFGLWVAVHTGSPEETNEAIKAGITTIEHGVRHGNIIGSDMFYALVVVR